MTSELLRFNYNNLGEDEKSNYIMSNVFNTICVISNLKEDDERICNYCEEYIDLAIDTLELNEFYNASIMLFSTSEEADKWFEKINDDYLVENCFSASVPLYNEYDKRIDGHFNFFAVVPKKDKEDISKNYDEPWNLYIVIDILF